MLSAVSMLRELSHMIDFKAYQQSISGLATVLQASAMLNYQRDNTLQQQVEIKAEFPGVSDHNEIEEAFNNLINTASQYAFRRY